MNLNPEFQCYPLGSPEGVAAFAILPGSLVFSESFDYANIDNDGDFELKRLVAFTTRNVNTPQTEATREIPSGIRFNIRDDATGRTVFSGFADTGELFGDGRVPFVLPTSHFFRRGGRAQVLYDSSGNQGADFDGAIVWLIMVGAKHFK